MFFCYLQKLELLNFNGYFMNFTFRQLVLQNKFLSEIQILSTDYKCFQFYPHKRKFCAVTFSLCSKSGEKTLVVVGGGAAGVYGAIRAKTIAPDLHVVVIEKGKPLSKVKISGGGRCNVTNGHSTNNLTLAGNYPRGNKELRGSFFDVHGPMDTMSWFSKRGVELKTEDDGRVFPISNSSSTIINCLMSEAKKRGVILQTGCIVTCVSTISGVGFSVKIEKRTIDYVEYIEADYIMIASGSSQRDIILLFNLVTLL